MGWKCFEVEVFWTQGGQAACLDTASGRKRETGKRSGSCHQLPPFFFAQAAAENSTADRRPESSCPFSKEDRIAQVHHTLQSTTGLAALSLEKLSFFGYEQ